MDHLHGAADLSSFTAAGLSRWTVARRVRRGDLARLARGVAALPGAPGGPKLEIAGAVLAIGGQVCVTGATAAWWRGFLPAPPATLHLAVPERRGRLDGAGCDVRREQHFEHIPIHMVDGVPMAGVNWTLMDAARDLADEAFAHVVARAIARRATSLPSLVNAGTQRGRWHGSARFRRVTSQMSQGFTHSREERYARGLLLAADLRPHPAPFPIRLDGRIIAEADIAFVGRRLDVEVDGPHHLLPEQQALDRVRDRLVRRVPWDVARFSTLEIRRDPGGFVDEVRRELQQRAA